MTDTNILFPGSEIEVAGQLIKVGTFKFRHFPKIMKFLDALGNVAEDQLTKLASENQLIQLHGFTAIIAASDEMIFDLLDMIVSQDREWLMDLDLDQAFTICMAAWEVNGDFFARKILPLMSKEEESPKKAQKSQKTK